MDKKVIERFKIGGSAGHPSIPSPSLQRAIGTKIGVDIYRKELIVPTKNGISIAKPGDTIICYDDDTYYVEKGC